MENSVMEQEDHHIVVNVLNYGAHGDGHRDDSMAFLLAWNATCLGRVEADAKIIVPTGRIFLLQPIIFAGPCKTRSLNFEILGKIVAPQSLNDWKKCVGHWLYFRGVKNLILSGVGAFDGQGSLWWKSAPNYHENQCQRPQALGFSNCHNLHLGGFTVFDSPMGHISISSCKHVWVSHLHIRAPERSPNSEGIDISNSVHLNIHDCDIRTGDDCIAMNSGSSFINISNIHCGPGHGIRLFCICLNIGV